MRSSAVVAYAPVVIKLLQGPLFSDEQTVWNLLLANTEQVQTYFAQIGLAVRLHEEDGFAYLHQPSIEDDEGHELVLPRLTRRDRLNYQTTMLCVLLREQLDISESDNLDGRPCILTKTQLHELLLPLMPERTNEVAVLRKIDATIEQVVHLGFLKPVKHLQDNEDFEVRRIIKARINAERLAEIKEKLQRYAIPESQEPSAE